MSVGVVVGQPIFIGPRSQPLVSDCGQLCWSVITVYLPVHLVCYNRGLHQHYTLRQSVGWPCVQCVLNNSAARGGGLNSYERRPAGLQDTLVTTLHFPLPLSPGLKLS